MLKERRHSSWTTQYSTAACSRNNWSSLHGSVPCSHDRMDQRWVIRIPCKWVFPLQIPFHKASFSNRNEQNGVFLGVSLVQPAQRLPSFIIVRCDGAELFTSFDGWMTWIWAARFQSNVHSKSGDIPFHVDFYSVLFGFDVEMAGECMGGNG